MDPSRTYVIEREQWLPGSIEEVFAFYGDATKLEAITPPWLCLSVMTRSPIVMGVGTLLEYRLRWRRIPLRWTTKIEAWDPPHLFVDTQLRGPYRLWHHTHTFESRASGTLIRDEVRYRLPLGWLGAAMHRLLSVAIWKPSSTIAPICVWRRQYEQPSRDAGDPANAHPAAQ
jgi:ligand-binding SRPBCC domain-containing protein